MQRTRHYIFIDPRDIHGKGDKNTTLMEVQAIHRQHYVHGEMVRYHGYDEIHQLLDSYDKELGQLFLQLNVNYPALLADIGRYIILYVYGGVYHDLKCMSTPRLTDYLNFLSPDVELIGEEHPIEKHRVRNTNIVAMKKKSPFLHRVLQKIKTRLLQSKEVRGPAVVVDIGSGIYICEFQSNTLPTIFKYPFQHQQMLLFDGNIYKKNIKKWQNTHEWIFRRQATDM
jgi:hypothetical protein